jgi:uroporphyrinogen-III synthase
MYPCSSLSRNPLHDNRFIHPLAIYETKILQPPAVPLDTYSGVVFSSPSTAEAFFGTYTAFPEHLIAFTFGNPSHEKLRQKGVPEKQIITIRIGVPID